MEHLLSEIAMGHSGLRQMSTPAVPSTEQLRPYYRGSIAPGTNMLPEQSTMYKFDRRRALVPALSSSPMASSPVHVGQDLHALSHGVDCIRTLPTDYAYQPISDARAGQQCPDASQSLPQTEVLGFEHPEQTTKQHCLWLGCTNNGGFKTQSTLLRHVKNMHLQPKAFACTCGNRFRRKDNLRAHERATGHGRA